MSRPVIIFPHQLFKTVLHFPKATVFYMAESDFFFKSGRYPKPVLVLHRASMQALRERLLIRGHEVRYLDIAAYPTTEDVLSQLQQDGVREIELYTLHHPALEKKLKQNVAKYGLTYFTLPVPAVAFHLPEKNSKLPELPELWAPDPNRYVEEALEYVEKLFPANPGRLQPFLYPTTFADAADWLEDFLVQRLPLFPTYKAGLVRQSFLPILLGVGLLTLDQIKEMLETHSQQAGITPKMQKEFLHLLA